MLKILQFSYIAILVLILISSSLLTLSPCIFHVWTAFQTSNVNLYLQKVKVHKEIILFYFAKKDYSANILQVKK